MSFFFDLIASPLLAFAAVGALGLLILAWQTSMDRYEKQLADRAGVADGRPPLARNGAPGALLAVARDV